MYAYPWFFGLLSHLGHHSALSRVPVLHSRFSFICFACGVNGVCVHLNLPIRPIPISPLGVHMFVLYVCVSLSVLHRSTASHPSLLVVGGMVALRGQGNWRWEGPLGTPLGLVHWKRASSPVEAGTAGYL